MDWFNRLCYEHDRKDFEKTAIQNALDAYWISLQNMVKEGQAAFAVRYPTPGFASAYVVPPVPGDPYLRRTDAAGNDHDVTFHKHSAPPRITANYSDPAPAVILEVVPDAKGCPVLRVDGQQISIDAACEKIVRPILFP